MNVLPIDGDLTSHVYGLIQEQRYHELIPVLDYQLQRFPESRAALSLLAYCHYMIQNYESAASVYEQLHQLYPEPSYKLYQAQSLFKSGFLPEATKSALQVPENEPEIHNKALQLLVSIKFEEEDFSSVRQYINESSEADSKESYISTGALLFKEGKFQESLDYYGKRSLSTDHHQTLSTYEQALRLADEIKEHGIRVHPELSVGAGSDGIEVRSVGNSAILHETCLIEAFNLKIAVHFEMEEFDEARAALGDMPPRNENELDPITLHNSALLDVEADPTVAIQKLTFLLEQPPFPPETMSNLLILQLKFNLLGIAADIISENSLLIKRLVSQDFSEYVECLLLAKASPAESFRRLDLLAGRHVDRLRRITKNIQDARLSKDQNRTRMLVDQFDNELESYIPVLMAQAKVLWDEENYSACERLLKQSTEFCAENNTWKLNLAHCFFMTESMFNDSIALYIPVVEQYMDNLLSCQAIVLANLCVSYIMTSQNETAEEFIKKVEKEEELLFFQDPTRESYHSCIVNLVIGTLYCSKGNYEFGVSRIIKSFEPLDKKLSVDTWFYCKRCMVSLIDTLAKHWIILKDTVADTILEFLEKIEVFGTEMSVGDAKMNVSQEAVIIKDVFLKLRN
ncbi:hypothetical protein GEMRC1_011012 [Eukaryota sp. GEM-RC1]